MFHGRVSREIARGLRVLRERIQDANLPPSRLDETLTLATWNIREFGKRPRREASIHYIAEILGQFDLIAVTEVRDDITDLARVLRILGPYWKVIFSDYNSDRAGNRERVAYVYDKRAVTFTGLAAEADPPRKRDEDGNYRAAITWWRSPYMASFQAGNFDFILLTAHIRWGSGAAARVGPLEELAKWVDKRQKDDHVIDRDFVVVGDFNIPKVHDETFKAITSKGLRVPGKLLDAHNSEAATNLARNKRYDQILHYPAHSDFFTDNAGVLDFYRGDHRPLFSDPDVDKNSFTFELSDHLPLWIQLDTDTDDEELDQILGGTQE